jgi:hypothetical protein
LGLDCGDHLVNVHSAIVEGMAAAVSEREGTALAQELFYDVHVANIALIDLEVAQLAPFDEEGFGEDASEAGVKKCIVEEAAIGHGEFAVVFAAVFRDVEERPRVDLAFSRLQRYVHSEAPSVFEVRQDSLELWRIDGDGEIAAVNGNFGQLEGKQE